jgi:hypothetical protein
MESRKKEVIKSSFYFIDIQDIYEYGEATFGLKLADSFFDTILNDVENLETQYLLHPECRHLETKTKIYRNIILGSYFNNLQNKITTNCSFRVFSRKSFF